MGGKKRLKALRRSRRIFLIRVGNSDSHRAQQPPRFSFRESAAVPCSWMGLLLPSVRCLTHPRCQPSVKSPSLKENNWARRNSGVPVSGTIWNSWRVSTLGGMKRKIYSSQNIPSAFRSCVFGFWFVSCFFQDPKEKSNRAPRALQMLRV